MRSTPAESVVGASLFATPVPFVKGHGTMNDFVLVADPDAELWLDTAAVSMLCDRHGGVGADGLIRAVRAGALLGSGEIDELPEGVARHDWFMDYRNADGDPVQMCGNGARVFAHFLRATGLEDRDSHVIGTRAGAKRVEVLAYDGAEAEVSVDMGLVRLGGRSTARLLSGQAFEGTEADVGNPHLVCLVPELGVPGLLRLEFSREVLYDQAVFPEGVNVEFVVPLSAHEVTLRVFERGVGETMACGTGSVASAAVALAARGEEAGEVVVGSSGGKVQVRIAPGGFSTLRGPSSLVASGVFDLR